MLQIEELKKSAMIPINKYVVLIPQEIKSDSSIILPEKSKINNTRVCLMEALLVSEDCAKVKVGDFCIINSSAKLDKFEFLKDEFIMCREEDIGCVIRRPRALK